MNVVPLLDQVVLLSFKAKYISSDMETFKSYLVWPKLPTLRFPTLAQLKDGSFLNPKVDQLETEESWLKDFEVKFSILKVLMLDYLNNL